MIDSAKFSSQAGGLDDYWIFRWWRYAESTTQPPFDGDNLEQAFSQIVRFAPATSNDRRNISLLLGCYSPFFVQ